MKKENKIKEHKHQYKVWGVVETIDVYKEKKQTFVQYCKCGIVKKEVI